MVKRLDDSSALLCQRTVSLEWSILKLQPLQPRKTANIVFVLSECCMAQRVVVRAVALPSAKTK